MLNTILRLIRSVENSKVVLWPSSLHLSSLEMQFCCSRLSTGCWSNANKQKREDIATCCSGGDMILTFSPVQLSTCAARRFQCFI